MSINWNQELDAAEDTLKPIALGPHNFRVIEAKPTAAKSSGSPMISLSMKVEGGPEDGKVGYMNVVFTFGNPRAMGMTSRRLKSPGIPEEWLRADNPSIEQIAARMLGRLVPATVTHETYEGRIQSRIDVMMGGSGSPSEVPAPPIPIIPSASAPPTPSVPVAPVVAQPPPVVAPPPVDVPAPVAAPPPVDVPAAEPSAAEPPPPTAVQPTLPLEGQTGNPF